MPITLRRWQKHERRRWMQRMKVQDSRVVYRQKFVFSDKKLTAVTREYLLPGDKIFSEQYVFWQTAESSDVVMLGVREVEPYRYAFPPVW